MTRMHELPTGLGPWGDSLAPLVPELSVGLLPLVRGIDDLVHRQDAGPGTEGPLDGYDGLTTRGIPDRILMSEWALADELPIEFLRRAGNRELLHLHPAHRRPLPRGRVVVLVDVGPDQLGAPRLVQLAALVVLHRRAAAQGSELVVGLLGQQENAWLEGDLGRVLRSWRTARRRTVPTVADVAARDRQIGMPDEAWLLAGTALARQLLHRRKVLSAVEATWTADGATSLHVTLDRDTVELALPSAKLGVQALRGAAFRTGSTRVVTTDRALRVPRFNSAERRLLLRGERADVLYGIAVAGEAAANPKLKRYTFSHPVMAAAAVNGRLIAVIVDDRQLRVRVIGKQLWNLNAIAVPVADVGVERVDPDELPPVYIHAGSVVLQVGENWWTLTPEGATRRDVLAAAPGLQQDDPHFATVVAGGLQVGGTGHRTGAGAAVLGVNGLHALRHGPGEWTVYRRSERVAELATGDATVLAVLDHDGRAALVTVTHSGLHLVSATSTRTLTPWSGGNGPPSVHPTLPLIAVRRDAWIEVGHVLSGQVLMVVREGAG